MIKTKKVNKAQRKYELIPYLDYITDQRMIIAAQILAYSGYCKENGAAQGAITKAAREAKVNRTTIYDWLQKDEFQIAIRESRAELCAHAVKSLHKLASSSPQTAIYLAQTLAPEVYSMQYKKHLYEMETLKLKAQLGLSLEDTDNQTFNITIETSSDSRDYERNKIE